MEIGSEFWKNKNEYFCPSDTFFLSGRTAIDAIVRDAIHFYDIKSVLMPSYCCQSMIEPLYNHVEVRFYDVVYNEDNSLYIPRIPEPRKKELFFFMTYFGESKLKGLEKVDLAEWDCSVEDMTHSCFVKEYISDAKYSFASFRKWFPIDGIAIARKKDGILDRPSKTNNSEFSKLRNDAFELKSQYMRGIIQNKQQFLTMFNSAGEKLNSDYADRAPDVNSIIEFIKFRGSVPEIRKKRRQNAMDLVDGLEDLKGKISFISSFTDLNDCPLFFPIKVNEQYRDDLRNFLISKEIYCPIHWPIGPFHKGISSRAREVYQTELSLVCDQRYSKRDMKRISDSVHEFFEYFCKQ